MKTRLLTTLLLLSLLPMAVLGAKKNETDNFDKWFTQGAMRFDFYHCGNSSYEEYFFDEVKSEPYWAGSHNFLIDNTGYGCQMVKVFDRASGREIYSRAYSTLFNEWQTTDEATVTSKCMPESVIFPMPRADVRVELWARDRKGIFSKKFTHDIRVNDYFIRPFVRRFETFEVAYTGNPRNRVDIVLIPEGYTSEEKEKFAAACNRFAEALFSYSPFKENSGRFNIQAVWAPSEESGVTIPGEGIWRSTTAEASFYTFNSERYQMIENFQNLCDIAAHVPYEYIYVLSNTQKYGGGGIYNFYGISSANHPRSSAKVYVHEFGHVFGGLGDEYVEIGSSYNDTYPDGVEPWEPNLTRLVDFKSKPWSRMLDASVPVPTPVKGAAADALGVYEGGGYVEKGVYRPWVNCMMNNLHTIDLFCPVCKQSIQQRISQVCQ